MLFLSATMRQVIPRAKEGCRHLDGKAKRVKKRVNRTTRIELTGHKYGRLTVEGYAYSRNKKTYWSCVCDCGAKMVTTSNALRSGNTKSCGCLKQETSQKIGKKNLKEQSIKAELDLLGCSFGFLTVIEKAEKIKNRTAWLCKCECGNERAILTQELQRGMQSCGCARRAITVNGEKVYLTPLERKTLKENQVSSDLLGHRLKNGWELQKAINTPKRKKD